jgi:hypothetical protein
VIGGRVIALREGSIILITIVVAIYFSANTSTFFTGGNCRTSPRSRSSRRARCS